MTELMHESSGHSHKNYIVIEKINSGHFGEVYVGIILI